MATKMAELKFEAPLAQFEETDEWGGGGGTAVLGSGPAAPADDNFNSPAADILNQKPLILDNDTIPTGGGHAAHCPADAASDNFTETFSGSLEDLVNTFDEKITKCFCNYDESVEKLAPVQVRTQEEIMNECQWVLVDYL